MTVAAVSSVTLNLVAEAEKAVAQVKKKVVSSNDIIRRVELPYVIPAQFPSYCAKWGFRFVRFMQHQFLHSHEEAACMAAVQHEYGKLKFASNAHAIAQTRFGKGECRAVAILATTMLSHLGVPPCHFVLTSDKHGGDPRNDASLYGHMLLVLGISYHDLDKVTDEIGSQFIKILDRLKKTHREAVIVDPFLGCVSRIADYSQKAKPLLEYNKAYGTQYVLHIGQCSWSQEDVYQMQKEADYLYKLTKDKFFECSSGKVRGENEKAIQDFLTKKIKQEILPSSLAAAKELYPAIAWAGKFAPEIAEWTVAAQVSKDQAKSVMTELQSLSFKVLLGKAQNSKTEVMVTLQNPNPRELYILSAAQNLYTRKITNLINEYTAD